MKYFDYTKDDERFFERIIGFRFDANHSFGLHLPPFSEDLIFPTNRGADLLESLHWNFAAQEAIFGFNMACPTIPPRQFTRIVNGLFFDGTDNGLLTRRIKWIDFIPLQYDDSHSDHDSVRINLQIYRSLVQRDAEYHYPLPEGFKLEKLQIINRFVELIGNSLSSETDITRFLSEEKHKFILTMRFGASEIFSELICNWQSESRNNIKPDFFIVQPNGYADIVEFKLPELKGRSIVGRENRKSFSSEINSYISQTRVYQEYFDDPNNRKWIEKKYKFKVYKPRRTLIIGRRSDFLSEGWREVKSDYRDLDILSFDDLIDGVIAQFYL